MKKHTLLLCFIHGFKGDDGTFVNFPNHLRTVVQNSRPHLNVTTAIYPQYETRGELSGAVIRFREWLQNTIIDLEVTMHTPSPTIDPSVHTILIGHSMGGIVAADTLFAILDDDPVAGDSKLPFPHIAGLLAFDTPFLGLAPSVFAHSAEDNWKTATSAYDTISSIASGLFVSQAAVDSAITKPKELEDKESAETKNEPLSQSLWGAWGKVAAYSGAAAALAGGAAAAYMKREDITAGFGWVQSHLEFIGALMKGEELRSRVGRASTIDGIGFANLFTSLGGDRMGTSMMFEGKERTFCSLPADESPLRKKFFRCVNISAKDEVSAHCSMFDPKTNPGFYELADRAKNLVLHWVKENAYLPIVAEFEENPGYGYDAGSGSYGKMPPISRAATYSTASEWESKKSPSLSKCHRPELGRASTTSSRRSSRDIGQSPSFDRRDSWQSTKSSKEKDEKKKKHQKNEQLGSIYDDMENLRLESVGSPGSNNSASGWEKEKEKKDRKKEKRKSGSVSNTHFQMNLEDNPWR